MVTDFQDSLGETPQLDLSDPKLRITAQRLTQAHQSMAARAAAIHDYVRRLPFAASAESADLTAGEVLRRARGDCHSKGVLFTALCRAACLPARLLFVEVRTRFLAGLLDDGPAVMPHAVGQVLVDGRWHSTDGYVVDPLLFAAAKRLLQEHQADGGWGIVRGAQGAWAGAGDCLHQFRRDDVVRVHGVFDDAASFHAQRPRREWAERLRYSLGARLLNRRVAAVRRPIAS